MKKIILDTNFLLLPAQSLLDIFSEIERLMLEPYTLVVLDTTIGELEKLSHGRSKDAQAARLGLALINAKRRENPTLWEKLLGLTPQDKQARKLAIIKSKGHVDDAIVRMADKDTIVATQDAQLKHRLKSKQIPRIVASKKHLKIEP